MIFVEYKECKYKRTKTQENQGQRFLSKEQLNNMQYSFQEGIGLESDRGREQQSSKIKVQYMQKRNTVVGEASKRNKKREVFCPLYRTKKKMPWWNQGEGLEKSVPRTQKRRAEITDLKKKVEVKKVIGTANQKAV